jgi:leader peptidase (prepilin peptidase)/N-methyltransferase
VENTPIFIFSLVTFAVFGLLFGSFATMASYRIPRKEDLIVKSSHCPKCKHNLSWFDLFPLFSWLSTLGKCRYCGTKISARYPMIELSMATAFTLIYLSAGFNWLAILLAGLVVALVISGVIYLERK